jgi:hypothetical protein
MKHIEEDHEEDDHMEEMKEEEDDDTKPTTSVMRNDPDTILLEDDAAMQITYRPATSLIDAAVMNLDQEMMNQPRSHLTDSVMIGSKNEAGASPRTYFQSYLSFKHNAKSKETATAKASQPKKAQQKLKQKSVAKPTKKKLASVQEDDPANELVLSTELSMMLRRAREKLQLTNSKSSSAAMEDSYARLPASNLLADSKPMISTSPVITTSSKHLLLHPSSSTFTSEYSRHMQKKPILPPPPSSLFLQSVGSPAASRVMNPPAMTFKEKQLSDRPHLTDDDLVKESFNKASPTTADAEVAEAPQAADVADPTVVEISEEQVLDEIESQLHEECNLVMERIAARLRLVEQDRDADSLNSYGELIRDPSERPMMDDNHHAYIMSHPAEEDEESAHNIDISHSESSSYRETAPLQQLLRLPGTDDGIQEEDHNDLLANMTDMLLREWSMKDEEVYDDEDDDDDEAAGHTEPGDEDKFPDYEYNDENAL